MRTTHVHVRRIKNAGARSTRTDGQGGMACKYEYGSSSVCERAETFPFWPPGARWSVAAARKLLSATSRGERPQRSDHRLIIESKRLVRTYRSPRRPKTYYYYLHTAARLHAKSTDGEYEFISLFVRPSVETQRKHFVDERPMFVVVVG